MKNTKSNILTTRPVFKSFTFILFGLFLMNCSGDEEAMEEIGGSSCDEFDTYGTTLIWDGEEVPIYEANLRKEERIDSTRIYSFNISAPNAGCTELLALSIGLSTPIEHNTIPDGRYEFEEGFSDEERDLFLFLIIYDLHSNTTDYSSKYSGTVNFALNNFDNYTLDIKATAENGREVDLQISHQF